MRDLNKIEINIVTGGGDACEIGAIGAGAAAGGVAGAATAGAITGSAAGPVGALVGILVAVAVAVVTDHTICDTDGPQS